MKQVIVLLTFLMLTSCARKMQVQTPAGFVRADSYVYTKDDQGRVFVVTTNGKDFDNAMKAIQPGPSTVNKFDLWVITPAAGQTRKEVETQARPSEHQ
jgi:hypothetical protein